MDEMSKQGLYLWLKSVVETGKCQGVTWVDEQEGSFQIPWSNQKSRNWQQEDSSIFMEYAKHTGKYKPGDKVDFPKWKQNLKSAINKSRFIERVRKHDRLFGSKPHRVYQFLSERSVRSRSHVDVPDVVMNAPGTEMSQSHLPVAPDSSWAAHCDVTVAHRDTDFSGPVTAFLKSGPRSSSSLSSSSASGFPLSPDIPRNEACDMLHGNIPTIVEAYYDDRINDFLPEEEGEDDVMSLVSGSTAPDAPQMPAVSTGLLFNQQLDVTGLNISANSQSLVECPEMCSVPVLSSQTPGEQSEILSHSMAVTTSASQAQFGQLSTFVQPEQSDNLATELLPIQGANNSVRFQQSSLRSDINEPRSMGGIQAGGDMAITLPGAGPYNSESHGYVTQACAMTTTLESSHGIDLNTRTTTAQQTPATPLPELNTFNEASSDAPTSMDTYDANSPSSTQNFAGPQFITYRDGQTPQAAGESKVMSQPEDTFSDLMHVQVLYGTPHRVVTKVTLTTKQRSCRLFHGGVRCQFLQAEIQRQQDAIEVELPSVEDNDYQQLYDTEKKNIIRKILKDMEQGIVISYRDDNIFIDRRCLPRIYLSDGVSSSESLPRSTRKRPDVETLAFDYKKFQESIARNKTANEAVPRDHFLLTIGYPILANDDSPTRMVPVYVVVRHVKAAQQRFQILGASAIAPNPMCSDPNSFDKTVQLFKELDPK